MTDEIKDPKLGEIVSKMDGNRQYVMRILLEAIESLEEQIAALRSEIGPLKK